MDVYPIEYLKRTQRVDNFVHLIEQAEQGDAFTLTRDGKPVAVVLGWAEWERLRDAYVLQEVRYGRTIPVEAPDA